MVSAQETQPRTSGIVEPGPEFRFVEEWDITGTLIEQYTSLINGITDGSLGYTRPILREEGERLLYDLTSGRNNLVIAHYSDSLAGSGALRINPLEVRQHVGQVSKVVVDPDYRRRGIGSGIIDKLEERAEEMELESLVLAVKSNQGAIHLYLNRGFEPVGCYRRLSKVNGRYFDLITMQKMLVPEEPK